MEKLGGLRHISTGDLFRKLGETETLTAKRISEVVESGGLPFDDIATTLWMHEIAHNVKEDEGFILDGAPRRVPEAENFDRFMDFLEQRDETAILLIDISRQESFDRLMKRREHENRKDDTPKAINNRLDYYEERVVPMVEYYKEQGRLVRINGEQSVEGVHKEILEKLNLQ